jgi:hypothetical protein
MDINAANAIGIEIFNSLADGKDGTLSVDGGEPAAAGYFVGGASAPLVFGSLEKASHHTALGDIIEFLKSTETAFVGWWTDSETGKVYVDDTTWHSSLALATHAAQERSEIAFWDIANAQEVRTPSKEF